jgi:hypothetical protein
MGCHRKYHFATLELKMETRKRNKRVVTGGTNRTIYTDIKILKKAKLPRADKYSLQIQACRRMACSKT